VPAVLTERAGEIAIVRLNRPERLNAINADIRRELPAALAPLNRRSDGARRCHHRRGDRAFSAGQDLEEGAGYGIDDVDRWFTEMYAMYASVRALDKPSVAASSARSLARATRSRCTATCGSRTRKRGSVSPK
jgi:enoyl-CoA hydratase/carnithine racemase